MPEPKLGKLLIGGEQRDATHVAIAPVIADENLNPGERVVLNSPGRVAVCLDGNPIGIVDPFLTETVRKGERFYLWLMPKTVTGMRHAWSHPDFGDESDDLASLFEDRSKEESEKWLRDYCNDNYMDYSDLIKAIDNDQINDYGDGDTYLTLYGSDASGTIPDELWEHAETVLDRPLLQKAKYFTCSC